MLRWAGLPRPGEEMGCVLRAIVNTLDDFIFRISAIAVLEQYQIVAVDELWLIDITENRLDLAAGLAREAACFKT